MKKLISLLAVMLIIFVQIKLLSQEIESLRKSIKINIPEKVQYLPGAPLSTGKYTVGNSGVFPSIDSAFNKLSTDGITGDVTIELTDDLYTAPSSKYGFRLIGPIPGSGSNSRVTIRPAINKNVTIEGNGLSVLCFLNTSYVTIDGVDLAGTTTLRIHSYQNTQYSWNDGIVFVNNSKHNVIQNIIFEDEDYTRLGCALVFVYESGPFTPDSNLIQDNFIKKGAMGISIISYSYRAYGNIIRGNKIGSESDSLISRGINLTCCQKTIVENNIIQNIRSNPSLVYSPGIVSLGGVGEIIRNNVIHNIHVSDGDYGGIGIFLNGITGYQGVVNSVYNNMVYNIQSTSPQTNARVCGIEIRNQSYPKVYYNSVYLSGTGTNKLGSAALYIGNNCSHVYVNNNILVNTRDESPYCASAIYDYDASNLTSDYNDLYYELNQYNCLVSAGGMDYHTLEDWQTMGKDLHSYTEMPHFVEPYLHIDGSITTPLNAGGTTIGGIHSDIDKDTRNATSPDIGADEFDGLVGVEEETLVMTEFRLEQNYPNPFNPSTTIRYSIPRQSIVSIKLFDILGNEIVTLLNEEKLLGNYEVAFNASAFTSGVYFYRLQAGSFVETKKMLLIK